MKLGILLEQLLEDVDEAAVAISQARSEKLALYTQLGDEPCIILYKPHMILEALLQGEERGDDSIDDNAIANCDGIVGFIGFNEHYHEGVEMMGHGINLAAAESGYGPMLYDIALSIVAPEYLMSDRNSVSKAAQNVWAYYFKNRADVDKKLVYDAEMLNKYGHVIPVNTEFDRDLGLGQIIRAYYDKISKIRRIKDYSEDMGQSISELESDMLKLEQEYTKRIIHNPLAYMYKIKRKKSFASLQNNHKAFCSTAPSQYSKALLEEALVTAADTYARRRI
jgi:hypothetical protein